MQICSAYLVSHKQAVLISLKFKLNYCVSQNDFPITSVSSVQLLSCVPLQLLGLQHPCPSHTLVNENFSGHFSLQIFLWYLKWIEYICVYRVRNISVIGVGQALAKAVPLSHWFQGCSEPLHLFCIKVTWVQTEGRWFFWDASLPSSRSASFLNKVAIPCSNNVFVVFQFIGL